MGSNNTASSSRPLTADERRDAFNTGMESFNTAAPNLVNQTSTGYSLNAPAYSRTPITDPGAAKGATYNDPGSAVNASYSDPGAARSAMFSDVGDARTMSGGDYDRLEQSMVASRTAPLERAWSLRKQDIDQSMADRGIWASGAPVQVQQEEFEQSFLPAYTQAGAEAATQRYGAQANELQALNQFALSRANETNQFNLADTAAQNQYQLSRAGEENQFGLSNAAAQNQFALSKANEANQFGLSNTANQNQYNLSRAGMLNEANMTEQDREYQAKWRPLDFAQGLYNNTGGVISSSSGGGWSI